MTTPTMTWYEFLAKIDLLLTHAGETPNGYLTLSAEEETACTAGFREGIDPKVIAARLILARAEHPAPPPFRFVHIAGKTGEAIETQTEAQHAAARAPESSDRLTRCERAIQHLNDRTLGLVAENEELRRRIDAVTMPRVA